MTIENKTDSQTASSQVDPVDYKQFIRKLKTIEYFLLGFQLSAYGFISGIFINLFIGLSYIPYSEVSANLYAFYSICFAVPAILLFLLFYRNRFFVNLMNKKSSSGFIYFSHWWRVAIPLMTTFLMGYYSFYAITGDFRFSVIPFVVFFIMLAIFDIFDKPLTDDGEIYILADSAIENLGNFKKVLFFWKKIAGKIEKELKLGDYRVSQNDLVFYFTQKVLETNQDLANDLVSFRDFLQVQTEVVL